MLENLTGKLKSRLFILSLVAMALVFVADLFVPIQFLILPGYLFLFLGLLFVFFAVIPLYRERRLVKYYWERTKRQKLAVIGLIFIAFLILVAAIGPFFTLDPTDVDFEEKNTPPPGFRSTRSLYDISTGKITTREVRGTWKHPLGTDEKGRDMLAMLLSGARLSLLVGFTATIIAVFIGTFIGALSAYLGGIADAILMRFTDVMMTFPFFLLLVLIIFLFGRSVIFIVLTIGLTGWTGIARIVRSEVLSLRSREFVLAAKALGAGTARIMFRHLIPNVMSTVIVIATLSIPGVILSEAALSFIGLGDPSATSWGLILKSGFDTIDRAWWVAVEPGLMLFFTSIALNFLGDGVRDAFDPTSRI